MKKIIKLTESELTQIVKNTIMELNKSTYDSAAEVAKEKGYKRLGNKFSKHGEEFGLNQDMGKVDLVVNLGEYDEEDEDDPLISQYKIVGLENNGDSEYIMTLRGMKNPNTIELYIYEEGDTMRFSIKNKFECLPNTRKDARTILKAFDNSGFGLGNIDIRSITYEDTGF